MKAASYREGMRCRDLWARMVAAGCKTAILPEFVLHRRLHGKSLTTAQTKQWFELGDIIDFNFVGRLSGEEAMTLEQYNAHIASLPVSRRVTNKKQRVCAIAFRRATMNYGAHSWCLWWATWPWYSSADSDQADCN